MKKLLALGALLWPFDAQAQEELSQGDNFVANNVLHVMFHEAGHAVIDQFQLPVIGQEEDAADSFATVEVLELYEDPYDILLDSAQANFIMQEQVDLDDEANYFGAHDLDVQRAYRIVCQAVGSDPEKYGDIAQWAELPEDRQESCAYDAQLANESWAALRDDILRGGDEPQTQVTLSFGDVGEFEAERTLLSRTEIMEEFRDYLGGEYKWPLPISVRVESCGEENAFYDPDDVSLIMCYEMVRFFIDMEKTLDE